MPLICARQPHGALKNLWVLELHIHPDMVRQAASEELHLLVWRQVSRVRCTGLECLHVHAHVGGKGQTGQVGQMVGAERRTEALVAQEAKVIPRRLTSVALEDEVPLLGRPREVVGRQADAVSMARLLAMEKLFALVQPAERIFLAIIGREGQLVETGNDRTNGLGW